MDNCQHWFYLCCGFLVLFGLIAAMIFRYFVRISRKGVILENNDREHEHKHKLNEQKIKVLEEKNGKEQKQIDELKNKLHELEKKLSK